MRFDAVSVAFGDQPVLIDADLQIDPNERVCLIGRNGAGKSTTLKLIAGTQQPDDGSVEMSARIRWSLLDQKLAEESSTTVRGFVAAGMTQQVARIGEFQRLSGLGSELGLPGKRLMSELSGGLAAASRAGASLGLESRVAVAG